MNFKLSIFIVREDCRIGIMSINGDIFTTLDLGTDRNFLPPGTYYCKEVDSDSFGNTFEIEVEGHSCVYFHNGNYPKDTNGCILLGLGYDPTVPMITHSKTAFDKFQRLLQDVESFNLIIEYM
jgi:hypothetical protein